ncbi:hypothetical protein FXO37_11337 [Capsicum annuum]|nr:hypothetical protein FXO37_11337 [Capsicum annuum]
MALASFRTDNAPKLKELYGELKSGGNGRIILTGKDVEIEGLTWIAKKSSGRAIVEGYFDFTILWELSFPNSDIRDIDDERLACKLSAFSPPDEWELENNTKEDKEITTKKLLEILESKKVLLIFVHSAGIVDSLSMCVVSRRIIELKANLVREILVTTALDKVDNQVIAKGRVIEAKHTKNQINVQESLSSCCELIGKTINRTPGLQPELLLENILMDFCCYENKFPFKRGSAHYSELITYWILEGFLGPFDCFENAYEKGHCVIMALAHHGFIENQQAGYVRKNVKMFDLSSCCCCRIEETVRLGLANVFEGLNLKKERWLRCCCLWFKDLRTVLLCETSLVLLCEALCTVLVTMHNNSISAILAGIKNLSREVARMNAGLDRLDSNISTMSERVEGTLVLLLPKLYIQRSIPQDHHKMP